MEKNYNILKKFWENFVLVEKITEWKGQYKNFKKFFTWKKITESKMKFGENFTLEKKFNIEVENESKVLY